MIKVITIFFLFQIFFLITGCSNNEVIKKVEEVSESPEKIYSLAMIDLDNEEYEKSQIRFKELEFNYPLSNEAIQAKIMLGFIEYLRLDYQAAIFKFNQIINKYPSHKDIDYVYYMKAISYFEQINDEKLDGNMNIQALNSFNQVINRFPKSKYLNDSRQKIILIKENIAAKNMDIAMFYHKKKKYGAALKRFKIIISDYSQSKFTPEALYRMVEIYYSLGMTDDAIENAALIAYNYPKSPWYELSYNLINQDIIKKEKKGLINKINKFLNINEKKE